MTERDEQHLVGRFWLAEHPEVVIPGLLDLSGPYPMVILAGQLTAPVELTEMSEGRFQGTPAPEFATQQFTVHGLLSEGRRAKVTLLEADAYPRNFQVFGDLSAGSDNGTQVFQGYWLIRGAHVKSNEPILKARVRFTYIDEWVGRSGLNKFDAPIIEGRPVDLSYHEPEPQEAEIPDGSGLISIFHSRTLTSPTALGVEIRHQTWLLIKAQALSLDALYSDLVAPVLNLASVMLDRPCRVTQMQVATENSEFFDSVYHPIVREDHPVSPIKPGYHYLHLPNIDFSTVANSIVTSREIDPIPAILAGALARDTGRFLETDLLELAACAEGFDRRIHQGDESLYGPGTVADIQRIATDAVRRELPGCLGDHAADHVRDKLQHFEPTYKERLARLIEYTQGCVPDAAGVATKWASSLVGARNDYAHLLPGPRNSWETNIVLWESLKWILGAAVMLHAGIDADTIKTALDNNQNYLFFMRKAKNYAPEIYKEASRKASMD